MEVLRFPSDAHLKNLRQRLTNGKFELTTVFTDQETWFYYAYDYGFHRVKFQTRDDVIGNDLDKRWYNADMAAAAEMYYCRKLGLHPPDIGPAIHREHSDEEVAKVERASRLACRHIAKWVEHSKRVFAVPRPASAEAYGVSAKPKAEWQDDDAIRRNAQALGLTA
jgi:hypothetical protein